MSRDIQERRVHAYVHDMHMHMHMYMYMYMLHVHVHVHVYLKRTETVASFSHDVAFLGRPRPEPCGLACELCTA